MSESDFDPALIGQQSWLRLASGERITLPVRRWRSEPGLDDQFLLGRCGGPTLDVGCGPGRLTAALATRGISALGVDVSSVAVRLTRARGAAAVHGSVFDQVPNEGRWRHVLLADGNIGIGGDPSTLLQRAAELLTPGGTVLVEVDPPGDERQRARVRLGDAGRWFPWAWLSARAAAAVAADAGLRLRWLAATGQRWFTELERR